MAKPGSDRDGAMVDKQAGKKVRELRHRTALKTTLKQELYQIYFCVYALSLVLSKMTVYCIELHGIWLIFFLILIQTIQRCSTKSNLKLRLKIHS